MANYSRPIPSPTPSSPHSLEHQPELLHDNPIDDKTRRRPSPLQYSSRRQATVISPTFHIDPERSSSSDNGSLATPFPFPPASYPLSQGPRDSVTTHHSSLYPQSTSSYSNTSPPSPSSPSSSSFAPSVQTAGTDADATSLDPHHPYHHILDPDDVSYRLRLLVRNNYFLPPAHSKPSQSELAAAAEQAYQAGAAAAKSPSLRDIFRVGKARTPVLRPNAPASQQAQTHGRNARHIVPPPPLRQVKSANALVRPSHTRHPTSFSGSATSSHALSVAGPVERRGRVVVIREKVEDIAVAAKEAEIQMRIQQQQQRQEVPRSKSSAGKMGKSESSRKSSGRMSSDDEDVIVDPTDAVDLPSYSFQPQASGVVGLGLGVDASGLSAGVLADQLPPPGSPDMGMSKEDMLWRKALLHQAVGLSMMSIPAPTPTSSAQSTPEASRSRKPTSSPLASGSASTPSSGRGSHLASKAAQKSPIQPILEDLATAVSSSPTPSRAKSKRRPTDASGSELTVGNSTRGRSQTHPIPPNSPGAPSHVDSTGKDSQKERPPASRPRPSSRHRASPAPQRSETPANMTMPLQPPPRRTMLGLRPSEPPIPQSPHTDDFHGPTALQRKSDEGPLPPRTRSPLFPSPTDNQETIRKTLSRPLLSEGYESEHTTRSSDYFTPLSPSLVLQSPSGGKRPLKDAVRESRSGDSMTSGSFYSEDENRGMDPVEEVDDELHEIRMSLSRGETPLFGTPTYAGPRSTFTPVTPVSPTAPSDRTRPSNESSSRTRPSHDSSSVAPRVSLADSHVSMFSTSFGPISSRQRYSRSPARGERTSGEVARSMQSLRMPRSTRTSDELIQPPPPGMLPAAAEDMPATGSELGLHAFGGAGEVRGGPSPALKPVRSSTTPQPSGLASRRSQHLRPLDLLSVSSLGPSVGVRSAPPVDIDKAGATSFLDFDLPLSDLPLSAADWKSSSKDEGETKEDAGDAVVYLDTSKARSRLSSNAETIVPSPMKGIFAAGSSSTGARAQAGPSEPVVMRFPNASNPYLQKPYADIDPTRPLTNTPPSAQPGFISSTLSTLSSIPILSRKDKEPSLARKVSRKKKPEAHELLKYARDPRARSTPTISPSAKVFADVAPGRHSNVSGTRGRFGHGIMPGDISPSDTHSIEVPPERKSSSSPNPDVLKLDGMVAQHLQAERDLLKKVARGATRGPGSSMATSLDNFQRWSWHQSHDQATVLLLVPTDLVEDDLSIHLDERHLIVSVRGEPPAIKGRLYGTINTSTSSWQLERTFRSHDKHRKSRTASTSAGSSDSSYAVLTDPDISSSFANSMAAQTDVDTDYELTDVDNDHEHEHEVTPTPANPPTTAVQNSPGFSSPSDSHDEDSDPSPATTSQRVRPPRREKFAPSAASSSRPSSPPEQSLTSSLASSLHSFHPVRQPSRLLTIHLEKERPEIWPALIVTGVPVDVELESVASGSDLSFSSASTATMSTSVADQRFNMDPTSLVGVGLLTLHDDIEAAFEYFLRAWLQEQHPVAAMKLATVYLPLHTTPQRSAVIPEERGYPIYLQRLGGNQELAKLYRQAGILYLEGLGPSLSASTSMLSHSPFSLGDLEHGTIGADPETAQRYFRRARVLDPSIELPDLPMRSGREVLGDSGTPFVMPSMGVEISTATLKDGESSRERKERRRRDDTAWNLVDDREEWSSLYLPGIVGAGLAIGIVGIMSVSWWRSNSR
ncbi:hypothetical protein FRB99_006983 [Tulasnella sp. 403]|nr:hypothetical protein FRB99_006983 [Tulasnella sp. 403]